MTLQGLQSPFTSLLAVGASVPIGTRGLVHIWGRNDMTTSQDLGIDWVITDPDGIEAEHYFDWSYGHGPGDDHEFIGGRFDINKVGDYMISAALSMNPASPVVVGTYVGLLCRVTEDYAGTIIKKELEYDSVRGAIPVS